jgi:hypothetical protein
MIDSCIVMFDIKDGNSRHDHSQYTDITKAAWQSYCKSNMIDFIAVTEPLDGLQHSKWNKHFVFNFIGNHYKKVGMVDFDTMPRWDAPNPFDQYTTEFCGVNDNSSLFWINNSIKSYRHAFPEIDVDLKIGEYINSGVLLFTREHQNIFERVQDVYLANKQELDAWSVPHTGRDQTILNLVLKRMDIDKKYLPYTWNTVAMIKKGMFSYNTALDDKTPFLLKYGNIWHFTGFPVEQRTSIIKQIWNQIHPKYK